MKVVTGNPADLPEIRGNYDNHDWPTVGLCCARRQHTRRNEGRSIARPCRFQNSGSRPELR